MEDLQIIQNPSFREYLLWKNQNINYNNLLKRVSKATNRSHLFGIMKSVIYDGNRFQFQDYHEHYLKLVPTLKKKEIVIFVPHAKNEFDKILVEKRLFEFCHVLMVYEKVPKIIRQTKEMTEVNCDINLGGWILKTPGINDDFLDIVFSRKVDKPILDFIHKIEAYSFMVELDDNDHEKTKNDQFADIASSQTQQQEQ